jgi:DNA-binding winged helix-turn-helix (wHTH) protein/Tfp pilus assembly protein PilF
MVNVKAAFGSLIIDEQTCSVLHGCDRVPLSRKATELIIYLGRARSRPVERKILLRDLWPDREVSDKALSMLVVEVRRQLATCFPGIEPIRTLPGIGYALAIPYEQSEAVSTSAWCTRKSRARLRLAIEPPALLSSNEEARELAACWHDRLLNSLACERGLDVVTRQQAAVDLEAHDFTLVVQSSVRIVELDLLLSVRCVTPAEGRVCWAASERGALAKAFDVETALCNRLCRELEAYATGCYGRQVWRQYRQSAGFAALADGQRLVTTRSGSALVAARQRFRQALSLDPGCAPALVGMADCEILSAFHDGSERAASAQRATEYVERALALDADLSSAHSTQGFIHLIQLRFASSERELLEAIRLDDSNAIALQWYADFLASQGKMLEAVQAGYVAVACAPYDAVVNAQLGQMLHMAGLYDEAQSQLERALALDPSFPGGHCFLALNLAMTGNPAALEHGRHAVELAPGTPFYRGAYGGILARLGQRERALQQLHALEANTSRSDAFGEAAAVVATALGQSKRAIDLLRKSTSQGAGWGLYAGVFPMLDPIWDEPAFKALVRGRGMMLAVR